VSLRWQQLHIHTHACPLQSEDHSMWHAAAHPLAHLNRPAPPNHHHHHHHHHHHQSQVLSTLLKIRRHDPDVFKPEVRFFDDDEEEEEGGEAGKGEGEGEEGGEEGSKRKEKPMYLRSVLAQQVRVVGCTGVMG